MNYTKLIISLFICLGLGSLGGVFTAGEINTWYALLQKPSLNPPNWVFGPVWTLLYILIGLSLYFFWNEKLPEQTTLKKKKGFQYFALQLLLNFFWSLLFFKAHQPIIALIDIIALIVFIVLTMMQFYKVIPRAAWILIPYLLWVCFATYLNFMIVKLN